MASIRCVGAVIALVTAVLVSHVGIDAQSSGLTSATQPVSPAVVMTWVSRPVADGQALDVLVLWRGRPGWFFEQPQTSVTGERLGVFSSRKTWGAIELALEFNSRTRTVSLAGLELPIEGDNVIFVDDVDTTPRATRTLRIDDDLPDAQQVITILRRSDDIVEFLRCGVTLRHPDRDVMLARLCEMATGRGGG